MDRLDAMQAFAAVAELGSFAEAARRLRLSPAAVTRAVAQLEDQLGLTLLNRTSRSVRLTERGALYLESCKQILAEIEGAERRVRGEDAAPRGTLTVAGPIVFGRLHVLPIVDRMLRAHPGLSIRLVLSDRTVHLVEEGVDVAVRIGELADSALVAVKVAEVGRVLVASPAYLAARGVPDSPAALTGHDLIAFESIDATHDWHFGTTEKSSVRVEPRLSVDSADAAIAAAEAGLGIARAGSYQVRAAVEAGRLRLLLPAFDLPPLPVSLIYLTRRLAAPNVVAFVKAARAHFLAAPVTPIGNDKKGA
ncbi:MAG: LysR family transcriptional regulator [Pseudomonadota bacterium]